MITILDVSNVQGQIDWKRVAAAGDVAGVYVKASEGRTYADPLFDQNRHAAALQSIHVGAYHFARPDHNHAEAEADHFLAVLGGRLHEHELLPALDLEVPAHGVNLTSWARTFNRRVQRHLGVWPLFYSYPAYIEGLHPTVPIGGGLWLAAYSRNDGREHPYSCPPPWQKVVMHQFASTARHPGIRGPVDVSHAHDLKALLVVHKRKKGGAT